MQIDSEKNQKKKITKKDVIYLVIIALLVIAVVTVSVLWGVSAHKEKGADSSSYYDRKCASFAVQNTNLSKGQIVFIGDSITDLFPLDAYFSDLPLATYNRGIGGDVTAGVLARMQLCLYDLAPTKIVLLIGINDINSGVPTERIVLNYRKILQGIRTNLPTTAVYCLSILPMNETVIAYGVNLDAALARTKEINQSISSFTTEFGYTYVDLFSSVADENERLIAGYSDDGLHLNANGFAVWANVIKPYLQGN